MNKVYALIVGALLVSGSAMATPSAHEHGENIAVVSTDAGGAKNMAASQQMMIDSMHAMHDMHTLGLTGDTDLDFLAGMIPHHEGAISMSEVIIPHLKDPKLVEFAEGIIEAQKEEIRFMKEWIEKNR